MEDRSKIEIHFLLLEPSNSPIMPISLFHFIHRSLGSVTGGPSSSCETIIFRHLAPVTWHPWFLNNLFMSRDGVVPEEAQFAKESGLPAGFQRLCVVANVNGGR